MKRNQSIKISALLFLTSILLGWFIAPRAPTQENERPPTLSSRVLEDREGKASEADRRLAEFRKLASRDEQVRYLIALASSIPIDEIESWLSGGEFSSLDERLQSLFRGILKERWLEVEPRELIAWAMATGDDDTDRFLGIWAERDATAATDYLLGLNSSQSSQWMRKMIGKLLKGDPALALTIAGKHLTDDFDPFRMNYDSLVYGLARLDLEAVMAMRENWSEGLKQSSASAILAVLFEKDFAAGMKFLTDENLDWQVFSAATYYFGNAIPRLCLEHADEIPAGWLNRILENREQQGLDWLEMDPVELGVDPEIFANFARRASFGYYQYDDERVMNLLNSGRLSLENRKNMLETRVRVWGRPDPDSLRRWLAGLQDEELFETADQQLVSFEEGFKPAPFKENRPADRLREIVAVEGGARFSSGFWNADEAHELALVFRGFGPDEKARAYARFGEEEIASHLPTWFGAELLADAVSSSQEGVARPVDLLNQLQPFMNRWANGEPAKSAEWVEKLPAGEDKVTAAREVAKVWASYSPEEARRWVETLPAAVREEIPIE